MIKDHDEHIKYKIQHTVMSIVIMYNIYIYKIIMYSIYLYIHICIYIYRYVYTKTYDNMNQYIALYNNIAILACTNTYSRVTEKEDIDHVDREQIWNDLDMVLFFLITPITVHNPIPLIFNTHILWSQICDFITYQTMISGGFFIRGKGCAGTF